MAAAGTKPLIINVQNSGEDHIALVVLGKAEEVELGPLMVVGARRCLLRSQTADALEAVTVEDKRHAAARLFNQLPVVAQRFSAESAGGVLPGYHLSL